MGRFLWWFLFTVLLLSALSAWATPTPSASLGVLDREHSQANLTVSRASRELTTLAMATPTVVSDPRTVDYHTYQAFGIPGEPFSSEEGSPTVPFVFRFVEIPHTGSAELVITNAEYDVVDNVDPFPVQPENSGFVPIRRNEGLYSRDGWYPAQVAELTAPMIMRDFRVVGVTLHPVQVNPVTHQARIYRNLTVDVVANNTPGENELLNPHRISKAWVPVYRSMISNLDDSALDDVSDSPGSYMILTSTNSLIKPWADTLAEWKTRKGFKVIVDARASWTASSAITAIRSAYLNSDPPLEYVALMGDPDWSGIGMPADGGNYDHSFALGNSGDDVEDIGVGRLSGGNGAEMTMIFAKLMAYERTPHVTDVNGNADTTWFHKAFLYAGVARGCAGNYTLMRWGEQQLENYTRVNNVTVLTHSVDAVDQNVINTQVNAGVGYFLWRGTWIGGMSSTSGSQTNPAGRFPITMTITCDAGDYVNTNGPAEGWLKAYSGSTPLGGVCGMGTVSAGTHNPVNVCLASGLIYNIADLQTEYLGTAVAATKAQLYLNYGMQAEPPGYSGIISQNFSRYFNMFGDPGLSMWTDAPEPLTVTNPASLNVGATSVSVAVRRTADNVPVQDALVVLWKKNPDSTWVKGLTDAAGNITLPVNVRQSGSMYLTVTKRNHKPYLYTIPCSQATVMPMLSTYTVDDDNVGGSQGNGDHILNPSETIDLPVYIRNFGSSTTATGISATLTSANPRVTVVSGTATYANLAPGDSALGSTPFRIQVASNLQNSVQVLLNLTINSSAGQTIGTIPLTARATMIAYQRQYFSPAFVPGGTTTITVAIKNTGTIPIVGATGHLLSQSPFVQVGDADAVFGDIAIGALDSNTTDALTLSAASVTYRGHQAPMLLVLSSSTGVDTVAFVVSVGTALSTDPTGPDTYGYYAYDNTDLSTTPHPTYSYVDISTTGTNLNLADPGDKTTPTPVYSAALHLPFSFKFYGRVYDSLTVCANGWCAFGNQAWYDGFRNYHFPAMQAPDAMIAPYWDDLATSGSGRGVWVSNDATNHRYIVQWKAGAGSGYGTSLDFEVMLYDTTYTPTTDGNGRVVMQYNVVSMNLANYYNDETPGCTIGIQAPGDVVGLEYAYQAAYAPGAATVQSGRAIMFSTENAVGQLTPTITMTAPNGGETWYSGLSYNINWSSVSVPGALNISLNRNYPAGAWESLFTNVTNTGTQSWTPTLPATSNARMRITSISLPAVGDTSGAAFTIAAPSLTVTNPNGGEILSPGTNVSIAWTSLPQAVEPCRVELNRSYPSSNWEVLSSSSQNSLDWVVTAPATGTARVRVVSLALTSVGDTSNANFAIGNPPSMTHTPHADQNLGPALFVARVTDDGPGFVTKLYYRVAGAVSYDSLTLSATGYPNEFAVNTPSLTAGRYEYYLRVVDAQNMTARLPLSGVYVFDVGAWADSWICFDDSVAENYNRVDVSNFKWAVKFDPGTYPYALTAGRFAICPTSPYTVHSPAVFQVIMADGPGGLPGTVVYTDTTGCPGNVIGGLPSGAAWAEVVTRVNNQSLQLTGPFYLAVANAPSPAYPVAFATDTTTTLRNHHSYMYDDCEHTWFSEDAAQQNNRPGDRMIRADGFPLGSLQVVIFRADSAGLTSSVLRWAANGAPYYHVYMSPNPSGPFDNMVASIPGQASGQAMSYTDVNAVNLALKRFYRVFASDIP